MHRLAKLWWLAKFLYYCYKDIISKWLQLAISHQQHQPFSSVSRSRCHFVVVTFGLMLHHWCCNQGWKQVRSSGSSGSYLSGSSESDLRYHIKYPNTLQHIIWLSDTPLITWFYAYFYRKLITKSPQIRAMVCTVSNCHILITSICWLFY